MKKEIVPCVSMCLKKEKKEVKIILEEDFIKQPFLKLYAKLKGNTNEITKTTHADESGTRDFEKEIYYCVSMCLKKQNKLKSKSYWRRIIKQPFLELYAELKGNTHGITKPHADESGTRDFEKEMLPCVSMCLKQEQIIKSKSYWRRISSSNHF